MPQRSRCLVPLLVLSIAVTPLAAQQLLPELTARQQRHAATLQSKAPAPEADARPQPAPVFGSPQNYRWEGALIGGIIGGAGVTYMGLRVCEENCGLAAVGTFAFGGVLGGFVGMVIGGLFPKQPPDQAHPEAVP